MDLENVNSRYIVERTADHDTTGSFKVVDTQLVFPNAEGLEEGFTVCVGPLDRCVLLVQYLTMLWVLEFRKGFELGIYSAEE